VRVQLARDALPGGIVHSIRPAGDDVLEIVFSVPYASELRGIRLERPVIENARGRLLDSSLEEIAFNVVQLSIDEPRNIKKFSVADSEGVH